MKKYPGNGFRGILYLVSPFLENVVKKSLEFDYPPPEVAAFRQIHGYATVISTACSGITLKT